MWCRIILGSLFCYFLSVPLRAEVWTNSTGQYQVDAEFVRVDDAADGERPSLTLKKTNGQEINVPLHWLSAASRQRALQLAGQTPAKPWSAKYRPTLDLEEQNQRIARETLEWTSVHLVNDPNEVLDLTQWQQHLEDVEQAYLKGEDALTILTVSPEAARLVKIILTATPYGRTQKQIGPEKYISIGAMWEAYEAAHRK